MASVTVPEPTVHEGRQGRPISSRLAGLARAVEGTRRTSSFDVRRIMLALGATCMGVGIVAIILGWYGAAHSAYLFQEIPYLISGGLLGVALVAGGGFLFFASWLVRMIEDNHRHASRLERTLDRVDLALGAIAGEAVSAVGRQMANGGHTGSDPWDMDPPMGHYREESSSEPSYPIAGGPVGDPARYGPPDVPAYGSSDAPGYGTEDPPTSTWTDPPSWPAEGPTEGGAT